MVATEFTINYQLSKPDFNLFGWHDDVNGNFDLLDAILFTLTGLSNFVGAWTNSTNYTEGQRVIDPDDASIWNCTIDHTSSATDTMADDRAAHPSYWSPITSLPIIRGAWTSGTVYAVGDIVYSSGEGLVGIANTTHTSTTSMGDDIDNFDVIIDTSINGPAFTTTTNSMTFTLDTDGTPLTALTLGGGVLGIGGEHKIDLGSASAGALAIINNSAFDGPGAFFFANSASPNNNDIVGYIDNYGRDDAGNIQYYGGLEWLIQDKTNLSEDSSFDVRILNNGAQLVVLNLQRGTTISSWTPYAEVNCGSNSIFASLQVKNSNPGAGGAGLVLYADSASPAAADDIGTIAFVSRTSTAIPRAYATIDTYIVSPTNAAESGYLEFWTMLAGTGAPRMRIGGGVYHHLATGTDKGDNTINFGAVYDDNTLLTCYVEEAAATGTVDIPYWDSKVPDVVVPEMTEKVVADDGTVTLEEKPEEVIEKIHEPIRKFAERLGTEYDPTTIAGQRKHVDDKKHLTPYPNPENYTEESRPAVGQWVQSGVEMDELLFLYIKQLEDRIKTLEAKP